MKNGSKPSLLHPQYEYGQQQLSSQALSLVRIVLNTLDSYFHRCRKVDDPALCGASSAYSRGRSVGDRMNIMTDIIFCDWYFESMWLDLCVRGDSFQKEVRKERIGFPVGHKESDKECMLPSGKHQSGIIGLLLQYLRSKWIKEMESVAMIPCVEIEKVQEPLTREKENSNWKARIGKICGYFKTRIKTVGFFQFHNCITVKQQLKKESLSS